MSRFSVKVGDNVAYSVQFTKSIGMSHSDLSHARGVVTKVTPLGHNTEIATIAWGGVDIPQRVNVQNLAIVGPNMRFCQC